jgi:hypothetical protein
MWIYTHTSQMVDDWSYSNRSDSMNKSFHKGTSPHLGHGFAYWKRELSMASWDLLKENGAVTGQVASHPNSPGRCWAKHWAECWGRRHARGLRQPRGFSWEVTQKRMYFMEISERRIWQTWRFNPHHGKSWNKPASNRLDPSVYPSWSTRIGHKLLVSPKRLLTPKSWRVADLWWYVHLHVANLTRRRHLRNPADRQWGSSTEA